MDPGNWIKFRVEKLLFQDAGPVKPGNDDGGNTIIVAPMTIYVIISNQASCAESGLGIVDWWA